MSKIAAVLNVTGDVHPNRSEPWTIFRHVSKYLSEGQFNLCQLEATISDKGTLRTDVRNPSHRVPPHNLEALKAGPFHGVTFAGNNALDYGIAAFSDTLQRLADNRIVVVGAGENLAAAQRPVYRKINGVSIGIVNACSILPYGYEATAERPGINPLPVRTYYEPLEKLNEQPGTPAKTVTMPDSRHLERVLDTIAEASDNCDAVIVCFHWGVHFTFDLAEYQAAVAYAAVDAGARLVVGTHPHCLQAVDIYRGVPILYSLGNFAFEQPGAEAMKGAASYLSLYGIQADTAVPGHPHPKHCRPSAIARVEVYADGQLDVRLRPTYLNDRCEPELVDTASDEFQEVASLVSSLSREIGTEVTVQDEYLILPKEKVNGMDSRILLSNRRMSYASLRSLATEIV